MIKVIQVGMTDNLGGIENYLINYDRFINKKNIKFDYINMANNKLCFEDEIKENGGLIYNLPDYKRHPISYIKQLKKILKENKYDILHYNMNSAVFLYPLIAAKMAKTKVIIAHAHNSYQDKGILKGLLHNINRNFISMYANTYFACSMTAGKWFFKNKILKSNNFYLINNAIDTKKFKFNLDTRNEIREELGIKKDEIIIGHVGRFVKQKNHQFLIDSFYTACMKNKKLKLILIGTGPLKDEITKKINELSLNDKVIFLENCFYVNKLYQAFDIFALPSLYEGLPLVGVEAQVSGLKCLFSENITDEINLTKLVKNLKIDSPKEWADEFNKFELNINIRKKNNIKEYDIELNSKKLYDIYINILNK